MEMNRHHTTFILVCLSHRGRPALTRTQQTSAELARRLAQPAHPDELSERPSTTSSPSATRAQKNGERRNPRQMPPCYPLADPSTPATSQGGSTYTASPTCLATRQRLEAVRGFPRCPRASRRPMSHVPIHLTSLPLAETRSNHRDRCTIQRTQRHEHCPCDAPTHASTSAETTRQRKALHPIGLNQSPPPPTPRPFKTVRYLTSPAPPVVSHPRESHRPPIDAHRTSRQANANTAPHPHHS